MQIRIILFLRRHSKESIAQVAISYSASSSERHRKKLTRMHHTWTVTR